MKVARASHRLACTTCLLRQHALYSRHQDVICSGASPSGEISLLQDLRNPKESAGTNYHENHAQVASMASEGPKSRISRLRAQVSRKTASKPIEATIAS